MLWSLSLLTVVGQCFFVSCRVYEYHLIEEKRTWSDAQDFCRENFTDLAVVSGIKDAKRIRKLVNQTGAWIGLYSNQGAENRRWHWSMPELQDVQFSDIKEYFHQGEPNDHNGQENCVDVRIKMLNDGKCATKHEFICFNETNHPNEQIILINKKMNWTRAQQYCRKHHTDLAGGLHLFNDTKFLSLLSESTRRWIGLFRDTWRWSDGSNSSFRRWNLPKDEFQEGKCALLMEGSKKWGSDDCNSEKPFLCYDDKVVLVKENKTWEEALYYCREKYDDLVSIKNDGDQKWVQERAKNASTLHVWLGLRYTCTLDFWFWISNEGVDYTNWAEGEEKNGCDMSGAMASSGDYKWYKRQDEQRLNFLCSKQ